MSDTAQDGQQQLVLINELLGHVRKIAGENDRGDLIDRLDRADQLLVDRPLRVVVAGQLKQGKSQLVNSLLNMPVARVGDDETTSVTTVIGYGEQPSAALVVAPAEQYDGGGLAGEPEIIPIPVADIGKDLKRAPQAQGREVLRVEVKVASPILKSGLCLVDTPGVGGFGQPHLSSTLGLLPDADVMLMVSDLGSEFTEPELVFIQQALDLCPVAAIVNTKTDLYPHWRAVVAANSAHLQRAKIAVPAIAVSSALRSHALQLNDKELNTESNFPALVTFLSNAIADQQASTRQQAIAEIGSASEHLTLTLEAELSALQDPQSRDELTSDLERRKREAEEALAHTALWQQVLGDGITDVSTDVEHDLQSRFRRILQRTEEVIDRTDPTKNWAEIGAKLEQAVANSVGNNFVWAHQRAMHLAAQVAETFAIDGLESIKMPRLRASEMGADLSDLKSLSKLEAKQIKLGHKAITGLRGSYGGVIMFGMLTSVAGLGMFNLISLGAGAMLGKKTYNEDMENRMLRIRGEAKTNVRRFLDDVSFVVLKESRDRLRLVQRQLRDHFREIANQTTRSLNESLQAAIASARLEAEERDARTNEVERQLHILRQVNSHVERLQPTDEQAARRATRDV
ncbi:dynamin-like GTPase family protein [Mycobacteroides abscessus]|uniref:dynamin-like GTPase family protein n=1 Tax=Mycobacteroides abscessus TaxID=36809 RepID=UPI0002D5C68F|nr:dynamin-like GTPase family protein [Mycobacteroides abscessus]